LWQDYDFVIENSALAMISKVNSRNKFDQVPSAATRFPSQASGTSSERRVHYANGMGLVICEGFLGQAGHV
jgi:hypothetical protein